MSLNSACWELRPYSRQVCGPMKIPKLTPTSCESNLEPYDCKADALPHDQKNVLEKTCSI